MNDWIQTHGCAGYYVCGMKELQDLAKKLNYEEARKLNNKGIYGWVDDDNYWDDNCRNWSADSDTAKKYNFGISLRCLVHDVVKDEFDFEFHRCHVLTHYPLFVAINSFNIVFY